MQLKHKVVGSKKMKSASRLKNYISADNWMLFKKSSISK